MVATKDRRVEAGADAAGHWICVISRKDAHRAQVEGRIRLPVSSERRARRLVEGDGVAIYSPRELNREGAVVQRFTAVGRVGAGEAYQVPDDPHGSWCRDVTFDRAEEEVAAVTLLPLLEFVRPGVGWGVAFRPGFVAIGADDFAVIRRAITGV